MVLQSATAPLRTADELVPVTKGSRTCQAVSVIREPMKNPPACSGGCGASARDSARVMAKSRDRCHW